jgi:uncharacterized membrane-anchored protein
MRISMKRAVLAAALAVSLCLAGAPALAEQAPYPKDEAALQKEYEAMNWQTGAPLYRFEDSHSEIALPGNFAILMGDEAQRYAYLSNGVEFPGTEALVYDRTSDGDGEMAIEYVAEGFVKDNDWSDIDADDFLRQMIADQKESNKERVATGNRAFEVIGWIEKPTYDAGTHIARYILELGTPEEHWVNAVAVKLGRGGYHQFTWVGDVAEFRGGGNAALNTLLDKHSYDAGHRYADFKDGDKVAAYGIAGLVAAVAGVKLGKGLLAGAFAFFAIAGKKLAILVIPLAAGLWAGVKRFFRRS